MKGRELSIEQVVHPLATASFVGTGGAGGNAKRRISSCEGSLADVDVALSVRDTFHITARSRPLTDFCDLLQGTGPWNLELQIVGPKGSKMMTIPKIETPRKTINVQIPEAVDKDGGDFEIDLGGYL